MNLHEAAAELAEVLARMRPGHAGRLGLTEPPGAGAWIRATGVESRGGLWWVDCVLYVKGASLQDASRESAAWAAAARRAGVRAAQGAVTYEDGVCTAPVVVAWSRPGRGWGQEEE